MTQPGLSPLDFASSVVMCPTIALESMDQDQEAEAKRRKAITRTRDSAKRDKRRAHRGKQIDPERLSKAITYLKKHPKR
jgi:hypothetical protein